MKTSKTIKLSTFVTMLLAIAVLWSSNILAMPPNPDNLEKLLQQGGSLPYYMSHQTELLTKGINTPAKRMVLAKPDGVMAPSYNVLAVLIKFSDKANSVEPIKFDTLLFVNKQGTVRDYYNQVSYGQLDLVTLNLPSSIGWSTAPQTYAYYCNGQNGMGLYPQNTQKLCEDIVDLINPVVNFQNYDNDLDGYVDALVLIHTGPGAEFTLSNDDIWSHQWGISPRLKDGVYIYTYSIQPEYWNSPGDITCGVFCHEFGHILGLPDLYDTDTPRDSYGIGKWSLMSYGSWNGPTGMGNYPAELDAWSRIYLGFVTATNVSSNINGASIASIESGGPIYRLWSAGAVGNEYFLAENRQKTGYDAYIPAAGLLVWHIDEAQSGNDNQWYPGFTSSGHFKVALEQADGLFELEKNLSVGNAGDPFPGSTSKTVFSAITSPNSNSYADDATFVGISNISASASTMTADFQVSLASDVRDNDGAPLPNKIYLSQNYPNPFNPYTIIKFNLPEPTFLSLDIYNILGQRIRTLGSGCYPAGAGELIWDGLDGDGRTLPSGVYFYELNTPQEKEIRKMVMVK